MDYAVDHTGTSANLYEFIHLKRRWRVNMIKSAIKQKKGTKIRFFYLERREKNTEERIVIDHLDGQHGGFRKQLCKIR
jgi:hypothetical protein